jgi:hypothetical protein
VSVTLLTDPKNLEGSITIIGETGTVRAGGVAENEIQHWEFVDRRPEDEQMKSASDETPSVYGFGHPLYYDNAIKVLRGEAEPETDGREGLKSLEVLIATFLSARDRRRVALPLDAGLLTAARRPPRLAVARRRLPVIISAFFAEIRVARAENPWHNLRITSGDYRVRLGATAVAEMDVG